MEGISGSPPGPFLPSPSPHARVPVRVALPRRARARASQSENHYKIHSGPHDYSKSKRSFVFICFESLVLSFCRSVSSCEGQRRWSKRLTRLCSSTEAVAGHPLPPLSPQECRTAQSHRQCPEEAHEPSWGRAQAVLRGAFRLSMRLLLLKLQDLLDRYSGARGARGGASADSRAPW